MFAFAAGHDGREADYPVAAGAANAGGDPRRPAPDESR